ncbi:MAG: DNA-3-methyladenine glycosylase family protein [Acidimicrobiia bacterium]
MDPFDRLATSDDALGAIVSRAGKPPPFQRPPTFASLVLLILEQQVSLSSAAAAYRRLESVGQVDPKTVAAIDDATLRAAGITRQKTRYLRELCSAVMEGRLPIGQLPDLPDPDVRDLLIAVPGIGPWTADVFLLACLQRPDIWPVGDRALQVGTAEALDLADVPAPDRLWEIGERWRPHRSAAARIIWHGYLHTRGRLAEGP